MGGSITGTAILQARLHISKGQHFPLETFLKIKLIIIWSLWSTLKKNSIIKTILI